MDDQTISQSNNLNNLPTPVRVMKELFAYYRGREKSLVELLYQYGAPQSDVARALKIDQAIVSRNYPKKGSK